MKITLRTVLWFCVIMIQEAWIRSSVYAEDKVEANGAYTQKIEIRCPPALAGMGPSLSFTYNSRGGNGIMGMGWSLNGLSAITIDPAFPWDPAHPENNHYAYMGNRLIYSDVDGTYHTKDESFQRIKAYSLGGSSPYWTVQEKNGIKKFYEFSSWDRSTFCLTKVQDTCGNYYEIDYVVESDGNDFYPSKITYTKNIDGSISKFHTIEFIYETRTDHGWKFNPGAYDFDKRLKWVEVKTNGLLQTKYRLDYIYSSLTGSSLLNGMQEYGSDGVSTLPALNFGWLSSQNTAPYSSHNHGYLSMPEIDLLRNPGPNLWVGDSGQMKETNYASIDLAKIKEGDFDGDGITDFVCLEGWGNSKACSIYYGNPYGTYYNNGSTAQGGGLFNGPTFYIDSRCLSRVVLGDFNGDGTTDFLYLNGYIKNGEYNSNGSIRTGLSNTLASTIYYTKPGVKLDGQALNDKMIVRDGPVFTIRYGDGYTPFDCSKVHPGDFNGDGITDLMVIDEGTDKESKIYYMKADGSFTVNEHGPKFTVARLLSSGLVEAVIDMNRIQVGDFNGDGITDVMVVNGRESAPAAPKNSTIYYMKADGAYDTKLDGPQFTVRKSTKYKYEEADLMRLKLGDFNGDGVTDVMVVNGWGLDATPSTIHYMHSDKTYNTGNGPSFTVRSNAWSSGNFVGKLDILRVQLGDFNGDGMTDLIQFNGWGTTQMASTIYYARSDGGWGGNTGPVFRVYSSEDASFNDISRVHLGDFNGDGLTDIMRVNVQSDGSGGYLYPARNRGPALFHFTDNKLDLVSSVENGRGGKTIIEYQTATKFTSSEAISPVDTSYPSIADSSPRMLALRVRTQDGMGGETSHQYGYSNGKVFTGYPKDQENLGFESVTDLNEKTRMEVRTYFYQTKPYQGLPMRKEIYQGVDTPDEKRVQVEVDQYTARTEGLPADVSYVYLSKKDTYDYSGSTTPVRTQVQFKTDSYGNPTEIIDFGEVHPDTGGDEIPGENVIYNKDKVTTINTYAINTVGDSYIMALSSTQKLGFDLSGSEKVASSTVNYFDGLGFGGIQKGLIKRVAKLHPDGKMRVVESRGYTQYGMPFYIDDAKKSNGEYGTGGLHTTQINYDPDYKSYVIKTTNALGQTTKNIYDERMRLVEMRDVNNQSTYMEYNAFGSLVKSASPGDTLASPTVTLEYHHDDATAPYSVITRKKNVSGNGVVGTLDTYTYYDGLNRVIQTATNGDSSGAWIREDTWYDNEGRPVRKGKPYLKTGNLDPKSTSQDLTQPALVAEYDALGRVVKITMPDGSIKKTIYINRKTTTIDENGHVKETEVIGNVQKNREFTGVYPNHSLYSETTTLEGVDGTRVTDAQGNVIETRVNVLGQKWKVRDPDRGSWYFTYDRNGNLLSVKDARQKVKKMTYDALNRKTKEEWEGETGNVTTYLYDETGHGMGVGRLTSAVYSSGNISYNYDVRGQVTQKRVTIGVMDKTFGYEYYSSGQLQNFIYPDGEKVKMEYDARGLPISLKQVGGNTQYVRSVLRDVMGNVTDMTYGNWAHTHYDYYDTPGDVDPGTTSALSYQLKQVQAYNEQNPDDIYNPRFNLTYQYDRVGNVLSRIDAHDADRTESYQYDDLNRLIRAQSNSYGGDGVREYVYDRIGNITRKDGRDYTYAGGKPHAVIDDGRYRYSYDENGSMVTGHGRTYTYNADGMMASCSDGSRYDYMGETRVRKQDADGKVTYYFSQEYEVKVGGGVSEETKHYYAEGKKVASRSKQTGGAEISLIYYLQDHLGSSSVILDASGKVVNRIGYRPYGESNYEVKTGSQDINVKYRYTGKELDSTGLYYYGGRYYDPELGRFLSADSIIPKGTPTQALNRYAYAANNPVKYTDPTGHSWLGKIVHAFTEGFKGVSNLISKGFSGFKKAFSFAVRNSVGLVFTAVGIDRIDVGFFATVGVEVGIDFRTGDFSVGVGFGMGGYASVQTRYGSVGAGLGSYATIGYDTAAKSWYISASGSYLIPGTPIGLSANGRYYINTGDYQVGAGVNVALIESSDDAPGLGIGAGISYSNTGGITLSANVGFPVEGGRITGIGISHNLEDGTWRGSVSLSVCFMAGTRVWTEEGKKKIEEIKVGDRVMAYNPSTGEREFKAVTHTYVNSGDSEVKVKVEGDIIRCTASHPFWVVNAGKDGIRNYVQFHGVSGRESCPVSNWIAAGDLQPGDKLLAADGSQTEVKGIEITYDQKARVYNLEVADFHTYCVGQEGLLVHNDCTADLYNRLAYNVYNNTDIPRLPSSLERSILGFNIQNAKTARPAAVSGDSIQGEAGNNYLHGASGLDVLSSARRSQKKAMAPGTGGSGDEDDPTNPDDPYWPPPPPPDDSGGGIGGQT